MLYRMLYAELNRRTDLRVDQMIEQGLVDELREFWQEHNLSALFDKGYPSFFYSPYKKLSLKFLKFHIPVSLRFSFFFERKISKLYFLNLDL